MVEPENTKSFLSSPEKKQGKVAVVELKNGKVVFKQKPMSLDKLSETLQEIVKFRELIEERMEKQEPPLEIIPDEHLPLIAKLGHESDKTLAALAKHMQQELIPPQDDDDEEGVTKLASAKSILPLQTLEQAIKNTLLRNNYGLESLNGGKAPAAVCVWRWEVMNNYKDWLPKSVREKANIRLLERVQAKESLRQTFEALPQSERDGILDPRGTNRATAKDASNNKPEQPLIAKSVNESKSTPSKTSTKNTQEDEKQKSDSPNDKSSRSKKTKDLEKAAKEKEKQEKRAAKAERDRKIKDSVGKSQNMLASFFKKAKPTPNAASSTTIVAEAGPSSTQSDYQRTFKPFVLKKGAVLAPTNWFKAPESGRRKGKEVANNKDEDIIIIDDDIDMEVKEEEENGEMKDKSHESIDVSNMSSKERLRNILSTLPPSSTRFQHPRARRKLYLPFKTYHAHPIREFMTKLSEAEVAGDANEVRKLHKRLQDRHVYPAKVIIHHEDARPGYFGTWTRCSKIIGPRTPFAKDVVEFDYNYDSGAEWEEEPMGDADDVLEDDDEDGDSDSDDSDIDNWLVDDDEEPELMYDEDVRDLSPPMFPDLPNIPPPPQLKRKAADPEKKAKKRKIVVPLVPFAKGPCWENRLGECKYEPFNQYRIQLCNDTPFPINPFTFVSTCVEDYKSHLKASSAPSGSISTTDGVFVVPALPDHVLASSSSSTNNPNPTLPNKKAATSLKFPDAHLPYLLNKITDLQMGSFVVLVETIYQGLKEHKVKKNAIEAKIREVGEKCKEKKVWVVKPVLKAQLMRS